MRQTDWTRLSSLALFPLPFRSLLLTSPRTHRYLDPPPSPSRDGRCCCWFLRWRCPALLSFFFFDAAVDASGLGAERSARKSALVIGLARGASAAPSPPPSPSPPLSDMTGPSKRERSGRGEKRRKTKKKSESDFTKRRRREHQSLSPSLGVPRSPLSPLNPWKRRRRPESSSRETSPGSKVCC